MEKQLHGRRKHHSGQSGKPGTRCFHGKVIYAKKKDAERYGPTHTATRCGGNQGWHAE